ncbi:MAG: sugar lactone lactonase YvrE [Granulosicoccus sp.]
MIPESLAIRQPERWIGNNLSRPECVVAHQSGLLIVPNWTLSGGISVISPTGNTHHIHSNYKRTLRPNGIALENGGSILLAHMGETDGGIYRLFVDGSVEAVALTVEGLPMPPTNFVVKDSTERIWITVSTLKTPRASDYRLGANSGFIAVIEPNSNDARIVADGLGYTNECVVDEQRGELWVNETFGRRLTRFQLGGFDSTNVTLTHPEIITHFGAGTYPDGLALDEEGQMWVTSIVSNRILRVSRTGSVTIVFEDSDAGHLQWTEKAFVENTLGREHLDNAKGKYMKNISNLAFGGPNRNNLYVGNLLGDSLPCFATDFCGAAMPHWSVPLGDLDDFL